MSKVNAFRCDYCGKIKESSNVVGISQQQDFIDALKSFPTIKNADKANVHGCLDCYKFCMRNADSINRKRYEQEYIKERDAAGFDFRKQCVYNAINKKYTPPPVPKIKILS